MDRLERAIRDFEDETLDTPLGDRISTLRSAFQWAAFDRIKRINKLGTKAEESAELDFKQTESMKLFKVIESMYYSQLRQNKLTGKAQDDKMDKDFLKRIREEQGSIGDIVRNLKPSEN